MIRPNPNFRKQIQEERERERERIRSDPNTNLHIIKGSEGVGIPVGCSSKIAWGAVAAET
jgi:hypothetical protein